MLCSLQESAPQSSCVPLQTQHQPRVVVAMVLLDVLLSTLCTVCSLVRAMHRQGLLSSCFCPVLAHRGLYGGLTKICQDGGHLGGWALHTKVIDQHKAHDTC